MARCERGRLPFVRFWLHPDVYRLNGGWRFGFWFAPWPREEHHEGDMVNALVMFDGSWSKDWGLSIYLWMADDARRPVGHNA